MRLLGSAQFIDIINFYGRGCLLFKADLKRAYRQIPVNPKDYRFLAYLWRGKLYFDTVFPFSLWPAGIACQWTTNAVAHIYFNEHRYLCINYINDFGGAASPEEAEDAFRKLKILLFELDLQDSPDKETPLFDDDIFKPSLQYSCNDYRRSWR